MFDHAGFYTGCDLRRQTAFYAAILAPLAIRLLQDFTEADGFGRVVFGTGAPGAPFLVIAKARDNPAWWRADQRGGASAMHLAFQAPSLAAVDAFHAIGLREGARDNGAPGDRGRGYYGAYLIDADANGIEAGFRAP